MPVEIFENNNQLCFPFFRIHSPSKMGTLPSSKIHVILIYGTCVHIVNIAEAVEQESVINNFPFTVLSLEIAAYCWAFMG